MRSFAGRIGGAGMPFPVLFAPAAITSPRGGHCAGGDALARYRHIPHRRSKEHMNKRFSAWLLVSFFLAGCSGSPQGGTQAAPPTTGGQVDATQQCPSPTPVFADEFNGTAVDTTKWAIQTGDGCSYGLCGWGNNELQSYQAANASVANGLLTITAMAQQVGSNKYTSARLRTLDHGGQWTHGRFEARIRIPGGHGMWPAFWMLPATSVGWPASGEIDIQEATGQKSMYQMGTIHYGASVASHQQLGTQLLKQPDTWASDFHVYAVEWSTNKISWYVDDMLYATRTPSDMANPADWTFENYKYYLILNLAVGGNLGGTVDAAALPQTMQVDYVRVYATPQPSISGKHIVEPNTAATYTVVDDKVSGSTYGWTSPTGETSTGNSLTVNWGTSGGPVSVTVKNGCGSYTKTVNVTVSPVLTKSVVLDDFESIRNLAYTTVTGTFNQSAPNPAPDTINSSATVGKYVRSSGAQYDLITATTTAIPDAGAFVRGEKALYLDVYSSAPAGTPILMQLENNKVATASNYPLGRHSSYLAKTTVQNGWQRLKFLMNDRIDSETGDTAVNQIVLMLNPNSYTGDTWYIDNEAIYSK
jgi:beta-glucanase (GH16 family)